MRALVKVLLLAAALPGSWPFLYLVAEAVMHALNIPHPHWR